MTALDIAVLSIAVAFAVMMVVRVRGYRFLRRRRRKIVCPKTSLPVVCTLVRDTRAGRWVDVEDCARWHGGELEGPCDRGCVSVLNLRLPTRRGHP